MGGIVQLEQTNESLSNAVDSGYIFLVFEPQLDPEYPGPGREDGTTDAVILAFKVLTNQSQAQPFPGAVGPLLVAPIDVQRPLAALQVRIVLPHGSDALLEQVEVLIHAHTRRLFCPVK